MVVSEIIAAPVPQPSPPSPDREKWEREQRAFYRLLGQLLSTHAGQYVAIHNESVVATGPNLVDVALQAYKLHGRQPIFVDLVTDHPLPAVRMPNRYRNDAALALPRRGYSP